MGLIYEFCSSVTQFFALNFLSLEVHGRENLIEDGPALIASNHQSFLDPPLVGSCLHREIHYLARKTLFDNAILGKLLPHLRVVGVDRDGADMSALKAVIRLVKEGGCTIVFPEGTRTHDGSLQQARAGLGLIVAKTLAPVVPVRIFGAFDAFPRSAKLPKLAPVTIVIGEPVRFTKKDTAGDPREVYQRISDTVMARIAGLENPRRS
jgi:1-acyl-sn-glycerol-3-phosphate acyltransferase